MVKLSTVRLRPDDVFFFMEYLSPPRLSGDHAGIVEAMRRQGIRNRIIGLVHLPPKALFEIYDEEHVRSALDRVDAVAVMGSNLADALNKMGYADKVKETFHYVDVDYYRPEIGRRNKWKFVASISGSLYRNRNMLREIVKRCPNMTFEICAGHDILDTVFKMFSHVSLNRFIPEEELLTKLQQSDVNLSVFDDTVGSNAITTSLGCGCAQIVSDVGAIRDYCSKDNAVFCDGVEDFVSALQYLKKNRDVCRQMGMQARARAEELSLENSIRWYENLFNSVTADGLGEDANIFGACH